MALFIIILIILVYVVVKEKGLWAARTRNSIVTWLSPEKGLCSDCRHCRKDESHRFSDADWFCSLSKHEHITPETRMQCCEKPKLQEADLKDLFSMGVWTGAGQEYIRKSLLGRSMGWSEINKFLAQVPIEHPEYIDQKAKAKIQNQ